MCAPDYSFGLVDAQRGLIPTRVQRRLAAAAPIGVALSDALGVGDRRHELTPTTMTIGVLRHSRPRVAGRNQRDGGADHC